MIVVNPPQSARCMEALARLRSQYDDRSTVSAS
jgi:hypothetical protein